MFTHSHRLHGRSIRLSAVTEAAACQVVEHSRGKASVHFVWSWENDMLSEIL
jgi:hypothetical protein